MHRRLAIGLWLAALALCALAAWQARYVSDLSSFLPSSPTAEQRLLVQQLKDGAVSRVMLLGIEGGDEATRARLSSALAKAMRADQRFSFVANGEGAAFERERQLLLANRYVLSPAVTPERFTAAGMKAAIGETLDLLASPAGLMLKSLVPRDPTGELVATIGALRPPEGPRTIDGAWATPDGKRAILVARTRAPGSDIDAQAEALRAAEDAFARARTAIGDAARDTRLVATGSGVFSARSRAMIEHDVTRLSSASAVAVILLLLVAYRSGRALVLGMVPVVSGALAGIAAVALGFGTVHGLTLGFGTTLIGEAVDYAIYYFVQGAGSRFWPTIRLGVLTSIAGFTALIFSGLPGLAQLGVYSIAGLVAAALVARFVLPALLPDSFHVRDLSPVGAALLRARERARPLRWVVYGLAAASLALIVARSERLWDLDIASLNPISAEDRALDVTLRSALGASDARHVVAVRGTSLDGVLDAAYRAEVALDPLVKSGALAGLDSPARFLPPPAVQAARRASLPDEPTLRARLREAVDGLPISPVKLEPFIADAAAARVAPPLTREAIAGTALEAGLDGLVFRGSEGAWVALLGLRPGAKPADPQAIRTALASVPEAVALDVKGELDRIYAGYVRRALAASAVGLLAIVALLAFALRSPARVATVMAPLVAAVLVVMAAHALAGTKLSLLHLVGLLLVAAIGSNYALFFDRLGEMNAAEAPRTVASLALANVTTVAAFGALALSSIPVLAAIGSTVAAGAFAALLFAALTARPIIPR